MMLIYKYIVALRRLIINLHSYIYLKRFRSYGKSVRIEKLGKLIGGKYISIGNNSDIQQMTYLTAWDNCCGRTFIPKISIGNDCHIGAFNHITCVNHIEIGDGFVSGKWVTITDNAHGNTDMNSLNLSVSKREIVSKGSVIIGKNVWLGDKVSIMPGVVIGDGVVVGANSVVTKSIPPYCIAGGIPARVIKSMANSTCKCN